jgi:hypothetical protein
MYGEEPPKELLEKVRTARITAGFTREGLKNILICRLNPGHSRL